MVVFKVLCLVLFFTTSCQCSDILYVVPFTSTSHYIMLRSIGLELARRGHNVTVITANKEKSPPDNYHEVMVDDKKIWEVIEGGRPNVFAMTKISAEKFHEKILWAGGLAFTEVIMNSVQVQKFLASDRKFDLVICEQFFQEATYILAHKYNTPLVLVTTFGNCRRHNIIARNPLQLSTVIPEFLDLKDPLSFWGRLRGLYFTVYEFIWWRFWYLKQQEHLVQKYVTNLTEPVPSLYEMQRKASLMLVNSHFSFDGPTAYLPNIIEIGGIHLEKNDGELPKDLKELLDQSKEGVIYMNFGSNVKSSELPLEKKKSFINVFNRLNQTVIWKWEDDDLLIKPKNVYVRSWLPQREILAHPNVKLFISHGGLIGTQEAIFYAVPIIGIPIYADQYNNLLQVQEKGFGKILQYEDINESYLEAFITEVLSNDTFKKRAVEVSREFKDRSMSALDTAMFWIEYVIRNNKREPLKNPALELSWISYSMIDVYLFIILCIQLSTYIFIKGCYIMKSLLFNELIKKDKKNN